MKRATLDQRRRERRMEEIQALSGWLEETGHPLSPDKMAMLAELPNREFLHYLRQVRSSGATLSSTSVSGLL